MMLADASNRLFKLEKRLVKRNAIALTLEGGGEFTPSCDPFSYLAENGRRAPDGRLITGIKSSLRDADPLTEAIIETLNEMAAGRMPLPSETAQLMEQERG